MQWLKAVPSKGDLSLTNYVALGENILGACENWSDESVIKLRGHLESAANQIESYATDTMGGNSGGRQPHEGKIAFSVGNIQRIFTFYDNLETAPNRDQVSIILNMLKGDLLSALKNGRITGDEFLSIIYHLIRESESA
jgi:hypothetical protein